MESDMTLTPELFEEIRNDLENDFPKIESITQEDGKIIINADNDTIWELFETLYHGVENIELNAGENEEAFLTITV